MLDSYIWFANLFSYCVDYLFIHFIVVAYAFGAMSKNLVLNPRSQTFSPMFSSKTFIVLPLTFRSLINFRDLFQERVHLHVHKQGEGQRKKERKSQADSALSVEPHAGLSLTTLRSCPEQKPRVGCITYWTTQVPLINPLLSWFLFVVGCKGSTSFICMWQLSCPVLKLKKLFNSDEMFLVPFWKSIFHRYMDLFLDSELYYIDVLMLVPHYFDYHCLVWSAFCFCFCFFGFVWHFKIMSMCLPAMFFFKIILAILNFHMTFRINLPISVKVLKISPAGILIEIVLNLTSSESTVFLTNNVVFLFMNIECLSSYLDLCFF